MKLIIDIDDELYKAICDCDDVQILSHFAIKNGTPYEERPHGEWIPLKNKKGEIVAFRCSTCGQSPKYAVNSDFCPRCGSDNSPKIHGCGFASEECAKNPCADCGVKEGEAK